MITQKPVTLISALIFLTLFFTFYTASALSKDISGKVIRVSDGDTITVLDANKSKHKIRLYGIDSPEGGQAFGDKAKKATSSLVYGKNVEINVLDRDRYGREVGIVFHNNTNINGELLKQGYAWVYTEYCKVRTCNEWLEFEKKARAAHFGLWADPNPIPPWEWRTEKRNASANKTNVSVGAGIYHGNIRSHVFHGPGCQDYNCKNCVKPFKSINEAMQAGYRPHKQCVK
jgi:micrococcal nuclease